MVLLDTCPQAVLLPVEATEAISFGDMLHGMGAFRVVGAEGQVFEDGKWMALYKQEDGALQLYRLIANSNLPLPEDTAGDDTMTGGGKILATGFGAAFSSRRDRAAV